MSDQTGKTTDSSPLKRALFAVKDLTARLEKVEQARHEPIAVIGMGCRFPGSASSPSAFWDLLRRGESAVAEVPADRWDIDAYYDAELDKPGRMYTRQGGFIRGADLFDPRFFGISPREAQTMDPQQRLLLEVAWEALEHSAQSPAELAGSSTGVFVGISVSDYGLLLSAGTGEARDLYSGTGNALSIAAGRLSYFLGLNGPALAVDTACSSSLMSVHLAIQSLRQEECAVALAGGVNLMFSPDASVLACRGHMLAPDGRCKTFDADADGYVRGEGCGIVVLKRLRDAVAAGDRVLAVLRGSAANQDGRSAGLTAPNGAAQEALMRAALRDARTAPADVDYVEAHGTGTNLGDPIEMRAIQSVYCADRDPQDPLRVGSVKTNIGHLEPAAGIAGLIKVVSSLVHEAIPASLNFDTPNPNIPWAGVPVEVPTRLVDWPRGASARCAGVSAFGFSGTNVHVIVQEAPAEPSPEVDAEPGRPDASRLLTLSARNERSLKQLAASVGQDLEGRNPEQFADACFSANVGRARFDHRLALVASSADEASGKLRRFADGDAGAVVIGTATRAPRVAFLFTGQGSQYAGMGRQLFESQPVFREAIDECDGLLGVVDGHRLIDLLYGLDAAAADGLLQRTGFAQPALFAVEHALTRLWRSWGIEPAAVLGHSVGEYAAACAAGVFNLRDGLTLLAARARLMQALPAGGGMLAVTAGESRVRDVLTSAPSVSIAAINGDEDLVLSGDLVALHAIDERLKLQGITTKLLHVSHAFHSTLMQPMVEEFERVASGLTYRLPAMRLVSNVTGRPVSAAEPMDAAYWRRHVLAPVQFGPSLASLRALKYDVFLEIGPHPVLAALGTKADTARTGSWLTSLRRKRDDRLQMSETVGQLFVRGLDFDARGLERPARRRKVSLPTYPFQRERCWIDAPGGPAGREAARAETALPGTAVRSALNGDVVFQAEVTASSEAFLADHAIFGTVVFPAAGYVSLALTAAARLGGATSREVVDLRLHEAFMLASDERRLVQTILSPAGEGAYRFGVYSAAAGDQPLPAWTRHASGEVRLLIDAAQPSDLPAPAIDEAEPQCSTPLDPAAFYGQLADVGIQYGPSYRRVCDLSVGPGQAIGRLSADDTPSSLAVPPAMLDAVFQVLGAAWTHHSSAAPGDEVYLPIGIRRVWAAASLAPGGTLRSLARIVNQDSEHPETIAGDVWCVDERGELVLAVEGFTAKRATREALLRSRPARTNDWLYEVAWRPSESPAPSRDPLGHWLVFADRSGAGARLAAELDRAGGSCTMVRAGAAFGQDRDGFTINPGDRDDYRQLFAAVNTLRGSAPAGVVHLWNVDLELLGEALPERWLDAGVASLMALTQASIDADHGRPGRMLVVTRGAQAAGVHAHANPLQAAAWGFARSIAAEHPELRCQLVDLQSGAGDPGDAARLTAEIAAAAPYDAQLAYRDGARLSPRLARADAAPDGAVVVPATPYELAIPKRGALDGLVLAPSTVQPPAAGEVQIRLSASALNFRDVLNALGMYPGDPGPLGSESAGEIVAVGDGVDRLRVGDRVVAIANRAFSTYVCTRAEMVQRIPDGLSDEDAVTIPAAYLTAQYGLVRVARMKAGDRVLIHAAAGGVGLAAVRVALRAGAEVFATAGNAEKRAFLQSIGVSHVMDSRSGAFAQQILDTTQGAGVDIVLNSLTGDLIDKSLSVLREGGRFVEIGKTDLRDAEAIRRQQPGVSYTILDLGVECRDDPAGIQSALAELLSAVQCGELPPLPRRLFPMSAVRDAFRFMAQARHVGKIVVRHTPPAGTFAANATYLITGGTGGLGLSVARWMVDQGARHLVLVGRSEASADARRAIASLEHAGAIVTHARADVGSREELGAVLAGLPSARPLRGIVHAAGCLDDGVIRQLTRERLERVMVPKVQGAWNLHQLTRDAALDFFLLFSSASSLFGSPGQSNYAAGNAFLDALAPYRRAAQLPGTSINWGAWSEVGMASRLDRRDRDRLAASGLTPIDPARGIDALREVMQRDRAQLAVLPIDWAVFARQFAHAGVPAFVAELAATASGPKPEPASVAPADDLLRRLVAGEPDSRAHLARTYVAARIESVLGLKGVDLEDDAAITTLGLDSLMAVELKNRFESDLGVAIPVVRLLEGPSVRELADILVAGMAPARTEDPPRPVAVALEEGEF